MGILVAGHNIRSDQRHVLGSTIGSRGTCPTWPEITVCENLLLRQNSKNRPINRSCGHLHLAGAVPAIQAV